MEIPNQYIKNLYRASLVLLVVLSVFVAHRTFYGFRSHAKIGGEANTITLTGHGEVKAVPDIANIYFTVSKDAATAKDAQAQVAVVEKKALDLLKSKGIEEKDIKTQDASVYPKYEYKQAICPPVPAGGTATYYCGGSKQVQNGFTASESITVKVRNVDDASAIMQGLATTGVSNLSGPNFAIDDEDNLKAEARKKAIDEAKEKAEVLAKQLGVRLGRVAGFSEGGNYGGPMYYAKDAAMGAGPEAPRAELPKGENTISSDVTITYEIR